jgi:Ca2+/Na+ antiporter
VAMLPLVAFLVAFSNVNLILRAPDVAMGTYGSLLASVCAVVASVSGVIALGGHRAYRTAIALNMVAALLGAMNVLAAASNYDGHPQPANILAILSAAACGATVPLLLRSKRRRTIH